MEGASQPRFKRDIKEMPTSEGYRRKREAWRGSLRKKQREEQMNRRRRTGLDGRHVPAGPQQSQPPAEQQMSMSMSMSDDSDSQEEVVGKILGANSAAIEELPACTVGLSSNDFDTQFNCVTKIRKLLSLENGPPIQEVIDSGALPALVKMLTYVQRPKLQFEAAWAITNIASGTSKQTHAVLSAGALPILVELLRSPSVEVADQACWALGNIAGDSPKYRNHVLKHHALQPLMNLCNDAAELSVLRNAAWTLSNICRGKPPPDFEHVRPVLPCFSRLLLVEDPEVLTDTAWGISYLSDDSAHGNPQIQAVIEEPHCCERLCQVLKKYPTGPVTTPALRALGNIVTGDDVQTQEAVNSGFLSCLIRLLENEKTSIRKEACWSISNICAGNSDQIDSVMRYKLIPHIVRQMSEAKFEVKKEAVWCVSNCASGGTNKQIRYLVREKVIPPLCDVLTCEDPKITIVALEALENILKVGAADAPRHGNRNRYADAVEEAYGVDKLEEIQQHENVEIYNKAVDLMQAYFGGEDEDDLGEQFAPEVQRDGTFVFGGMQPTNFNF